MHEAAQVVDVADGVEPLALAAASASAAAASPAAATPATASGTGSSGSFHELLSELNPLQYIPLVGTIYRAATGDTIPEAVRAAGSLVVSGLTGGPIGLAVGAATLGLEKATGIDPEKIGRSVLASLGIGHADTAPAAATTTQLAAQVAVPQVAGSGVAIPAAATPATGWSASQLSAYGITTLADGTLQHGTLVGSDVLNDLVLAANQRAVPDYLEAGSASSVTA